MRKVLGWSIIFILCLGLSCTAPPTRPPARPPAPPPPPPLVKLTEIAKGLITTNTGIDFNDTHHCPVSYASQTSDMTYNKRRQRTSYKIETTCTTTGEVHTKIFSNITYNQFGQCSGYQLKLSCSRTGKKYAIIVSQITYDNNWKVLSYTAEIDGKTYYYRR